MLKYGLIGEKLGHSISPHIHADIFRETSFDGDYKLYEIPREKLPEIKGSTLQFRINRKLSRS